MRKKPHSIAFRTSDAEYEMIREKAAKSKLTITEFIVRSCFDKEIIIVNDVRELMKELKAIGRNLNQLTTRANMKQLEVVDLKPTYLQMVEIYTVLEDLLRRVKG